jgi:hypothetical protein
MAILLVRRIQQADMHCMRTNSRKTPGRVTESPIHDYTTYSELIPWMSSQGGIPHQHFTDLFKSPCLLAQVQIQLPIQAINVFSHCSFSTQHTLWCLHPHSPANVHASKTTAEVTNAITRALFSSFRLFDSIFSKHLYPISITMHISHIFCLPSSCPGAMLQYNALSFESTSQRSASRVRQRTVYTSGSGASQSCVPPALLASTGMSASTYRDPLVSSFRLVAAIARAAERISLL